MNSLEKFKLYYEYLEDESFIRKLRRMIRGSKK